MTLRRPAGPWTGLALAAALAVVPAAAAATTADKAPDAAVKAAFLFNFAKFAQWPALGAGSPIGICVVGDDGVSAALVEIVRGRHINGRAVEIWRPYNSAPWRDCQVLFVGTSETHRSVAALRGITALPVLTVSDDRGFAKAEGGIVELYVQRGRMRFAINLDAVERSGLRLGSHLLQLATVTRDGHAP